VAHFQLPHLNAQSVPQVFLHVHSYFAVGGYKQNYPIHLAGAQAVPAGVPAGHAVGFAGSDSGLAAPAAGKQVVGSPAADNHAADNFAAGPAVAGRLAAGILAADTHAVAAAAVVAVVAGPVAATGRIGHIRNQFVEHCSPSSPQQL